MIDDKEYLDNMPLLEYLDNRLNAIDDLSISNKNDSIDFCNELNYRLIKEFNLSWDDFKTERRTKNFHSDFQILEDYKNTLSLKRKNEIIKDFRDNLFSDLLYLITSLREKS